MINSAEIWDFSQQDAITIALTESISPICQCQERNVILFREKKEKKTRSWGQRADRATDLSQMCISEMTGEDFPSTFGKNFVLSFSHYRANPNSRISLDTRLGVSARIKYTVHNSLAHKCEDSVYNRSGEK